MKGEVEVARDREAIDMIVSLSQDFTVCYIDVKSTVCRYSS